MGEGTIQGGSCSFITVIDMHTGLYLTCINPDDRLVNRCDTGAKMPPQIANGSVGNTMCLLKYTVH